MSLLLKDNVFNPLSAPARDREAGLDPLVDVRSELTRFVAVSAFDRLVLSLLGRFNWLNIAINKFLLLDILPF
jgi:hypothetical protein